MKYVEILSDRQFDDLAADVSDDIRPTMWEMWRDDISTEMLPEQLITAANSILCYFGSKRIVSDVQWDDETNCFLWEVQFDQ